MGKYAKYFKSNEIAEKIIPSVLSLVVSDLKTKRLVGLSKDTFEELLRKAGIPCQYYSRNSFATWDVLLPTEQQAAKAATNDIVTKYFRLQPEYKGTRRLRVTVCNVPAIITGEVLAAYQNVTRVFVIERSVRQGCPLSPLLYVIALEPLLRRLRDERTSPSLRGVFFAGPITARVSAFADDITVFVSRCLDIKAVKEAVVEYERVAGAKVNFDKSEGLRLGAWRGSNTLPGPFRWSDGPIRILAVWFGPDHQLEQNWSEIQTKVNAQAGIWLSRRLSLKGRAEACAVYVFPLILYRLAVFPLPKARRLALQQPLSRLLWGGARPMVRRQVCIQRTHNGGLGMPDLESHWLAERLAYLGLMLPHLP